MRWLVVALAACSHPAAPAPEPPATGYLKGQLHVHTNNSGDSETPPADVARFYAARGYDFIVLTDHNHVSTLASPPAGLLVIPGAELTQNLETCDPPPAEGDACLLHVNALFVTDTGPMSWQPPPGVHTRLELYTGALDETKRRGGIAQLNHPNFHWGADAALITALAQHGLGLFEVANESSDVANDGDATHPSTEALWDAVLATGAMLYGTATDDAHHYAPTDTVDTGDHGWVMVHAPRDPGAIRDALARGDFYASTGVTLRRIAHTATSLAIDATDDADFALISAGRVVARAHGRAATFPLAAGTYRAVVTDSGGRRAWVQPFRVP